MGEKIARIDAIVTVVYCDGRLLVVYNENWGAFTIPVTKLHRWQQGLDGFHQRWELGADAAMRNVAECLGITSVEPPGLLTDMGGIAQSDRSGRINYYHFQVFGFQAAQQHARRDMPVDWLTPNEILDPKRCPISPTARTLVAKLQEVALTRGGQFPPTAAPGGPRQSVSSIAIISRQQGNAKQWLCQWNDRWERYFLVGGHQEPGEDAFGCLTREVKEELGLSPNEYQAQPGNVFQFTDWSTSTWQQTDYTLSTFSVNLQADVFQKVDADAANRWLSSGEILSERCTDDKLVSPTTRKVLEKLNEL